MERDAAKREVILLVAAEGGGVTLYGVQTIDGWRFQRNVVDQTPFMLDEREIRHDSAFTSSWDEALTLLDRYPWTRFSPIRVHVNFRKLVWEAVQARCKGDDRAHDLERWRDRCDAHV